MGYWTWTYYFDAEHSSSIVSQLVFVKDDFIIEEYSLLSLELSVVDSLICFGELDREGKRERETDKQKEERERDH